MTPSMKASSSDDRAHKAWKTRLRWSKCLVVMCVNAWRTSSLGYCNRVGKRRLVKYIIIHPQQNKYRQCLSSEVKQVLFPRKCRAEDLNSQYIQLSL